MALVVLDTSVLIAFLDAQDAHHRAAVASLRRHRADTFVLPASAYAELLVGPLRRGAEGAATADRLLVELGVQIEPLTAAIARRAAALRAAHRALLLPDALVLATGEAIGAAVILTGDRAGATVSRRVRVLQEGNARG